MSTQHVPGTPGSAAATRRPEIILTAEDLVKHYPIKKGLLRRTVGQVKAVDGVSFGLLTGETLGIVGESGCGKSTLGRLLMRLEDPTSGQATFSGVDMYAQRGAAMRRLRRDIQIVFQDPYTSLNPRKTVGDIVGEPFDIHPDVVPRTGRRKRVQELLDLVGLNPEHINRYPHQFSGGQRQRIGIARGIALNPKVLICDEPVSALDVSVQAQVVNLARRLSRRVVAGVAAGTLLLTACTSDPAPPVPPIIGPPVTAPEGEIAIRGCTPEQPLLPAATVGPCGLRVTEAVNARLMLRDPATGAPVPDLAAAIDTEDSQNFTVRLARGRTFHDGTEVRARNFVAAWNWAAYGPNAMPSQTWFDVIEGAGELICPKDGPCGKDGRPTSMAGLAVLDDHTFTIRTIRPIVDLPMRLAHPVFSPLPDAFFAEDEGKEAFGRLPVGAGPFQMAGNTGSEITLEAATAYAGDARPKVRTVVLRKFSDQAAGYDVNRAYNEVVSDSLDFTDVIPTDQLVDEVWKSDLTGRFGERDTRTLEAVSFVATDPKLADPRLRQAISMAIDREALARQVFAGTRVPATSWVSPAVPGYRADACGGVCDYDLGQSRRLYEEAGGYPGEFQLTVNADGGHKPWADSVCNQLKNALDLDCQVNLANSQADATGALQAGRLTGLIRQGWTGDSLSARSHLEVYDSRSRLNLVRYDNPAFDAALDTALSATTQAAANEAYRNAELLLAATPPAIPLWFASTPHGWSTRVDDVRVTPNGSLDLSSIRRT